MKEKIKKWLKPVLFTAGGALVGLAYYCFVVCSLHNQLSCCMSMNCIVHFVLNGGIDSLNCCLIVVRSSCLPITSFLGCSSEKSALQILALP